MLWHAKSFQQRASASPTAFMFLVLMTQLEATDLALPWMPPDAPGGQRLQALADVASESCAEGASARA